MRGTQTHLPCWTNVDYDDTASMATNWNKLNLDTSKFFIAGTSLPTMATNKPLQIFMQLFFKFVFVDCGHDNLCLGNGARMIGVNGVRHPGNEYPRQTIWSRPVTSVENGDSETSNVIEELSLFCEGRNCEIKVCLVQRVGIES